MSGSHTRGISPRFALAFQASIGLIGLVAIGLFGIEVATRGVPLPLALALGALGGLLTYGLLLLLTKLAWFFPSTLKRHVRELHAFVSGYSWPVLTGLALLAGVGEELLFRGAIQGWVAAHSVGWLGIIAGAVLFGLAHFLSFAYFLVAALLGAFLGTVYALSESIILVMTWHGVYDLVAIFAIRQYPSLFGIDGKEG